MQSPVPVQKVPVTSAPPPRTPRCLLDSAESQALLARHGIRLTGRQMATFRSIENRWGAQLFNPDTAGCLVNGRFDQAATDGYFLVLDAVWRLGPTAPIEDIVRRMAEFFPDEGVAYILYAATVCLLFSDAVAHEAYRQLMRSRIDKRRSRPRAAIRAYKTLLALADEALERATQRPLHQPHPDEHGKMA